MSFLSSIKRALGFGGDDIDDDLDEILNRHDNPTADDNNSADANTGDNADSTAKNAADHGDSDTGRRNPEELTLALTAGAEADSPGDPDLAGDLFDGVLQVFNAALPDFVERSIDQPRQRQQLLEELDAKLTRRLEEALDHARRRGLREIAAERTRLTDELKRISDLNKVLDERQRETNSAKLSAERQKRALNSRVHDLENQVAALEAEKEQLDLEAKSMLSRMRAAGVAGQLPPANSQALIAAPKPEADSSQSDEREQQLQKQLDEAIAGRDTASRQLEESRSECDRLTKALEQFKARQELSDAMINSLQSKASDARRHAEELQQQLLESRQPQAPQESPAEPATETDATLKTALAEANALAEKLSAEKEHLQKDLSRMATRQAADTSTIATLKAQAAVNVERIAALERQVAETAVTPEQMATIEQHVEQLSHLKENLTQRNRELKEENSKLRQDLDKARAHAADSLAELRMQREARAQAEHELKILKESGNVPGQATVLAEPPAPQLARDDRAVAEAEQAETSGLPEQPCTTVSIQPGGQTSGQTAPTPPDADFTVNPPEKKRRGRPRKNRLTAIAETVENNDWFRAPTEDESAQRDAAERSNSDSGDFGYRQPARRPAASNDEQMSLW